MLKKAAGIHLRSKPLPSTKSSKAFIRFDNEMTAEMNDFVKFLRGEAHGSTASEPMKRHPADLDSVEFVAKTIDLTNQTPRVRAKKTAKASSLDNRSRLAVIARGNAARKATLSRHQFEAESVQEESSLIKEVAPRVISATTFDTDFAKFDGALVTAKPSDIYDLTKTEEPVDWAAFDDPDPGMLQSSLDQPSLATTKRGHCVARAILTEKALSVPSL